MLRLFGGVLIFTVSAYYGFHLSDRLKKRRDFLRAMSGALAFVLAEIEFGRYDIAHIFRRADIMPALCGFFGRCIGEIKEKGLQYGWERAVRESADIAYIKNCDCEALLTLGAQIGMTDVSGQKNALLRAIAHIDKYTQEAEEEYQRLAKPYRSCGVLLGAFLLIIAI